MPPRPPIYKTGPVLNTVLHTANHDRVRYALADRQTVTRLLQHAAVDRAFRTLFNKDAFPTNDFVPYVARFCRPICRPSTVLKSIILYRRLRRRRRTCAERPSTSRNRDTDIRNTCSGCRQPMQPPTSFWSKRTRRTRRPIRKNPTTCWPPSPETSLESARRSLEN